LAKCSSAGADVARRVTTGTAAYFAGRGIICTLALPHVGALVPDATASTLLNRNVRGLLRGFAKLGAPAHYFGREWIALGGRPAGVLGFDMHEDGAVLIELFAGIDASMAVPSSLASPFEQTMDRYLGKLPASLQDVAKRRLDPIDIANGLVEGVLRQAGATATPTAPAFAPLRLLSSASLDDDPTPLGYTSLPPRRVPIGWIDVAAKRTSDARSVWLGGDVLTATFALDAIACAAASGVPHAVDETRTPIAGASFEDLVSAAHAAHGAVLP
jgi:hypothetical protein